MPFGLVRQLQTDPNRFTGVGAIGCVGHQFGAHLTRGDDRASIGTGAKLGYGGRGMLSMLDDAAPTCFPP